MLNGWTSDGEQRSGERSMPDVLIVGGGHSERGGGNVSAEFE